MHWAQHLGGKQLDLSDRRQVAENIPHFGVYTDEFLPTARIDPSYLDIVKRIDTGFPSSPSYK